MITKTEKWYPYTIQYNNNDTRTLKTRYNGKMRQKTYGTGYTIQQNIGAFIVYLNNNFKNEVSK